MATQQQQQRISQVRLLQYSQERARQFKLSIRRSFELYTRLSKSGAGGRRRKNKKEEKKKRVEVKPSFVGRTQITFSMPNEY
jgi:hypothetical protein